MAPAKFRILKDVAKLLGDGLLLEEISNTSTAKQEKTSVEAFSFVISLDLTVRADVLKILEGLWRVQHIAEPADAIEQMKSLHVSSIQAMEAHLCGKSSAPHEAQVQALHDVAVQLLEDQAFVQSSMKTTSVLKQNIAGINAVASRIAKLKGAAFKLT